MQIIPIITYHKVSDQTDFGLTTVSCQQFRLQMEWLSENGFETIVFEDLFSGAALPPKPVMLTFDDGYECIYHNAIPQMQRFNFTGIIYIITQFIGKTNTWEAAPFQRNFNHLSKAQIEELSGKGFEFGAHGENHLYLPVLSSKNCLYEIKESKNKLEKITGKSVLSFCYPYGRTSRRVSDLVRQAGYKAALCNLQFLQNNHDPLMRLQRRSIYACDSLNIFSNKLKTTSPFQGTFLTEWAIQKGALASIAINILNGSHHLTDKDT